ncbi:MAG: AtpZ/AtpI family protein [Sneathiellales bacterium]|nr:AtpZ/AtpI family protein [Sneathiellales bacterium]
MTEQNHHQKEEFKSRLEAARRKKEEGSWDGRLKVEKAGAAGRAWRLSVEMIAALLVCGGFGWFLDKQFETKPILLLVFVVLGMCVGVYNAIKVGRDLNQDDLD